MATIKLRIPVSFADDPSVLEGRIDLEQSRYRLVMRWSPRDDDRGMWRMDVYDSTGVLRVAGIPLVLSDDVLRPFHYPGRRVPPGRLQVSCDPDPETPDVRRDPGLHDFGRAASLEYVESNDAS